ncbi:MAG: glutathione S-transferase [Alphaproteobacteria bacterium]|nr:glutathione S-transferase [Alphaproteobacteria bacterium]
MPKPYTLYAAKGGGSMIVELAFAETKLPLKIVDIPWEDTGWSSRRLKRLNPLGQVPTLILPNGDAMSESAGIMLYLAERAPTAKLAPAPTDRDRARFLRWLVFLVAAVYPTFTYGDDPKRWLSGDEQAAKKLRAVTDDHRKMLWKFVEKQIKGPWFLGRKRSALDFYVWTMSHWRPGKDWMSKECPTLHAIAGRVRELESTKKVAKRNGLP